MRSWRVMALAPSAGIHSSGQPIPMLWLVAVIYGRGWPVDRSAVIAMAARTGVQLRVCGRPGGGAERGGGLGDGEGDREDTAHVA